MRPDFTLAQADDLAKYFLGAEWFAVVRTREKDIALVNEDSGLFHSGRSWREVFRAAGVQLPLRPQHVAQGLRVMLADRAICTAASNTLAKRVAAALNNHIPDRRGI